MTELESLRQLLFDEQERYRNLQQQFDTIKHSLYFAEKCLKLEQPLFDPCKECFIKWNSARMRLISSIREQYKIQMKFAKYRALVLRDDKKNQKLKEIDNKKNMRKKRSNIADLYKTPARKTYNRLEYNNERRCREQDNT